MKSLITRQIALFSVEELDDQEYIALITVEDLESDDEEGALLLYRYNEDPEDPDTFSLDNIETDEEYETSINSCNLLVTNPFSP